MNRQGNIRRVLVTSVLLAWGGSCVPGAGDPPTMVGTTAPDGGRDSAGPHQSLDGPAPGTREDSSIRDDAPGTLEDAGQDVGDHPAMDTGAGGAGADVSPAGVCPAPPLAGGQIAVYGDVMLAGWTVGAFGGSYVPFTKIICTGTRALEYAMPGAATGLYFFNNKTLMAAGHLSVSVHLDVPGTWTIAAVRPGADVHQFLGKGFQLWKAGWQRFEFDIPATTTTTQQIIFEKQGPGPAHIVVDDLRLTPR